MPIRPKSRSNTGKPSPLFIFHSGSLLRNHSASLPVGGFDQGGSPSNWSTAAWTLLYLPTILPDLSNRSAVLAKELPLKTSQHPTTT